MAGQDYREIAAIAQTRRYNVLAQEAHLSEAQIKSLPKDLTHVTRDPSLFSENEIEILEMKAEDLVRLIRHRTWTAIQVTEAFCKAAAIANQLTNCLTEILFTEARAQAKRLDEHMERTGEPVGPLHGLPISLKDCFITPPHSSSIGIAAYANEPTTADQESAIPKILRSFGAVLYVKTNVPVAMMMEETDNNVWGPTVNPYNTQLSAGGSSGGEAALLALRGSPLGVGTDIGGSIRIPSAWCGLYGLRPSFGRLSALGIRSGIPGQEFVLAVNGPMARSLDSVRLYCSAVLSAEAAPWNLDPKCLPLPWKTTLQIQPPGRKLRFAFVGNNDGKITCHPPIERALTLTRQALEAAGHMTVDWQTDLHEMIHKTMSAAFLDFGGTAIVPLLEQHGEPVFSSMHSYKKAADLAKEKGTTMTPDQLRTNNMAKYEIQTTVLDRWRSAGIDAVIMAVHPQCAVRRGFTYAEVGNNYVAYTGWVNVLDLPSCTLPVTKADQRIDARRTGFTPLNQQDAKIQADYDPEFYDGAPVALQIVGERLQEEKLLEMVGITRDALTAADGIKR